MEIRPTRRLFVLTAANTIGVAALGASAASATPQPELTAAWTNLAAGTEPDVNPLKGFMPFAPEAGHRPDWADPDFPHSMEWFYIPVNSVVTGPDTYDYTLLEQWLNDIASRGHHAAFRFYLDYPGRPTGVPSYLLGPGGVEQRKYDDHDNHGKSFSPNYDDPRLLTMLTNFIQALGKKYDGDRRIGYLSLGLFGFWGEWHTWPYIVTPNWMPNEASQKAVLDAYDASFKRTHLLVRFATPVTVTKPIGFHDDSFAYSTLPTTDWHFLSQLKANGVADIWQKHPIGGELYPPLQGCIFSDPACPGPRDAGRDYNYPESVKQSHASWLMNQHAWKIGYPAADRARAIAASKSLGYSLRAVRYRAEVNATARTSQAQLEVTNQGVAPFYAAWPVEFSLFDASRGVVASAHADRGVNGILPGQTAAVTATISTKDLSPGRYTLLARVMNPLSSGVPLRFANATQDKNVPGYLSLGEIEVKV